MIPGKRHCDFFTISLVVTILDSNLVLDYESEEIKYIYVCAHIFIEVGVGMQMNQSIVISRECFKY